MPDPATWSGRTPLVCIALDVMNTHDVMIRADSLGKCYQIYDTPGDRLKQFVLPRLRSVAGMGSRAYFHPFWALRDVSFELRRGETVGIMGRNGAGKSTLLQLVCGTATPTAGSVETRGRLAALLELGAGFNPDFTGRENALLSCQLLGLSADEAGEALPRIFEFADIGEFAHQPVKHYSSGMYVRLAFAVSVAVEPDVMVVDEALAVGDIRFQAKCFARLRQLQERGCAILLVSHSIEQIARHCDSAMLIDGGRLIATGHPKEIGNRYMDLLYGTVAAAPPRSQREAADASSPDAAESGDALGFDDSTEDCYASRPLYNPSEYRWGDRRASILDFRVVDAEGRSIGQIESGEACELLLKVHFRSDIRNPVYGFYMKTIDGILLTGCNSRECPAREEIRLRPVVAGQFVAVRVALRLPFSAGHYLLSVGIAEDVEGELVPLDRRYDSILLGVVSKRPAAGLIDLGLTCDVMPLPFVQPTGAKRLDA